MLHRFFITMLLGGLLLTAGTPVFAANPLDQKINDILPPDVVKSDSGGKDLPSGDFKKEIVPKAIKILLTLVGSVSVCVFVYAGIMLIMAQGNEEELKKFKEILIWSAIGLVFITTAYALVRGIMQLSFQ